MHLVAFGDAAFLAVLGEEIDAALNRQVHRLARHLAARHRGDDRWGRPVPGYASLLVPFDPLRLAPDEVRAEIARAWDESERDARDGAAADIQPSAPGPGARSGPVVEVPVAYGGADGPDLESVADRLGLAVGEVVERHAAPTYTVFLIGFAPGFPYLGPLPDALVLPRRDTPRVRVPAGSVAIAGRQTGIYPFETPGGWHLIGRTALRLWDPARQPPALLEPGAAIRFVPS